MSWKSHAAAGVTVTCHQNQNQKMKEQSGSNRHGHGSSSSSTAKRCISSGITRALVLLILLTAPSSTVSSEDSSTSTQSEILTEDGVSPFRIVIDVGSTGSRLHIFELVSTAAISANSSNNDNDNMSTTTADKDTAPDDNSPRIECLRRGSSKAWTPLSAFASSSTSTDDENSDTNNNNNNPPPLNATHVAHHMLPLFEYASIIIPPNYHPYTPVRIAATAGMRLLPLNEQTRVYDALYEGLIEHQQVSQHSRRFTFTSLKREDVLTLNGEREGFYGAVAANYLRGVVDADLKVIVPPDYFLQEEDDEILHQGRKNGGEEGTTASGNNDDNTRGICTNKFGMCEQDAEDVVFGPSHHYVPSNMHDVKRHGPLGALDMGGSSTQIVYRNNGGSMEKNRRGQHTTSLSGTAEEEEEARYDDVPSHLNDEEFFSTSYLSYGADQFRERLWDLWVSEARKKKNSDFFPDDEKSDEHHLPVIFNPCSFVGYQMTYKHHILLGTGNAILCAEQINRLIPHHDNVIDLEELYDENAERSRAKEDEELHEQPQTIKRKMVGGVEHPPLRGKFYGMSLYFFTLDCLRELSDPDHPIHVSWPTPSIEELTHALDAFCARNWQGDLEEVQHEAHEHTRAEVLPHRCVESVYMVTLLRDGFGFHPSSRDITFTQWVEGNEVEWSLGMALSEFAAEKGKQSESTNDGDI